MFEQPEQPTVFDRYHPCVALLYFAALLVFAMCAMQPVYLLLTFAGALVFGALLRGWRTVLRALLWQVPVVLLIAVLNPVFSAAGTTVLFRVGTHAFYLESFVFGACQGLMLVNVVLLLQNAAACLGMDKVLSIGGNVLPNVALMVSMVARLVPQYLRRGRRIAQVSQACTAAHGFDREDARVPATAQANNVLPKRGLKRRHFTQNLRLTSVLMGWGLEDSIESAQAMQARGWGAARRRTTYALARFRATDACAVFLIGALAVSAALGAYAACAQWSFYPSAQGWAPWFSYAPYVVLVFLSAGCEFWERAVWS